MTPTTMPTDQITFGTLLYNLRRTKELTQEQLAEASGLDDSYISYLERGLREHPTKDTVLRLAHGLGASVEERDWLLVTAGYAPIRVQALLYEPKLGDLDDILSNLETPGDKRVLVAMIDTAIEQGRAMLERQYT